MIFRIWDESTEPVEVKASNVESAALHWLDSEQNEGVRDDIIANGADVSIIIDNGEEILYHVNYELSASVRRLR
jgi:hypothetical protein